MKWRSHQQIGETVGPKDRGAFKCDRVKRLNLAIACYTGRSTPLNILETSHGTPQKFHSAVLDSPATHP